METNLSVDVKINIDEFQNASKRMINLALKTIGQNAEEYAKKNCPVGSPESTGIPGYIGGTLRNSITNQILEDEQAVIIGTDVQYGKYVELGEHAQHLVGQAHFLRDSIAEHVDQYKNIIKEMLENG